MMCGLPSVLSRLRSHINRKRQEAAARHGSSTEDDADVPDSYAHLSEIAAPEPVENPQEGHIYHHRSLEETLSHSSHDD